jgi:hypothetical protein
LKAVKEQYPTAGEDVITNQKIFLKTDGKMTMPDMSGWSRIFKFHLDHGIFFQFFAFFHTLA